MPSTMMHLMTALHYKPNASTRFLVGNVVPDAVRGREAKERSHYRDRDDREAALEGFARAIREGDDFSEGVLLHLFLDWKWDTDPLAQFKCAHAREDWFPRYRNEINKSGSWSFHQVKMRDAEGRTFDWRRIWEQMLALEEEQFGGIADVPPSGQREYLRYLYDWFVGNSLEPSEVFTPRFEKEFRERTVREYVSFRRDVGL